MISSTGIGKDGRPLTETESPMPGITLKGVTKMRNALSVDVEEHFQVSAFSKVVRAEDWTGYESRVVQNTGRVLDILTQHDLNMRI